MLGDQEALTVGREERNCGVGRHTQQGEEMAMTGGGTSSAIVPKEEQAGVDMIPHGDNPLEGRDLGAAENMIDTVRAGKAQVARNDQHKGYRKGQLRQRPPKDQSKDCAVRPQHQ